MYDKIMHPLSADEILGKKQRVKKPKIGRIIRSPDEGIKSLEKFSNRAQINSRNYRDRHPERSKRNSKNWRLRHPERFREQNRKYTDKMRNDPDFRKKENELRTLRRRARRLAKMQESG